MIKKIVIKGAKEHNLKNVSVEIPKDQFVVITGLSGSGKSSLAFDTIYAEGQRRYVESLSGKTVSWKDSLQNNIENLYQIYRGVEILQQEFEADLLRLHTKEQEKTKQLLEITHDIVEHEVDISLNRQNIGLVGDTISNINNGLAIAENNLAKNINQT